MHNYIDEEESSYQHHSFKADKGQSPLRVDKYLINFIENTTRNKLQKAIEAGNVYVNHQVVKSNYKVKPNDLVEVILSYPPRDNHIDPQELPLDIVYEDQDIVIINKSSDMVVHPGFGHHSGTLVHGLKHHLQKQESQTDLEGERPGIVHRIDKDTTGLMVIAKNEYSLNHLAGQFFHRRIKRQYLALVWGNLPKDEGTIEGHIGRSLKDRKQMTVYPDGTHGKMAITHYKVIERFSYVTLVCCELETGRTHQIRAHFKYIGHPLFGDKRYGGDKVLRGTTFSKYKQFVQNCFSLLPRQALHAQSLGFLHPKSKEFVYFESKAPEDLGNVIEKWRIYTQSGGSLG